MRTITIILFSISLNFCFSQDIVKVMQYNLLNYDNNTSYCTSSNNSLTVKNASLKTIIDNTLPDIFSVNEMGADNNTAINLMNNCLNVNGRTWYSKAGFTNNQGSDIVNMLYYDNRKFSIIWQEVIPNNLRDINVYHLYYKSPDVVSLQDTAYLTCIVAHLKAGSTSSDETYRYDLAQAIMQYVQNRNKQTNYLLMGDFNLYTASEPAMQEFIYFSNPIFRFNDPINQLGDWNNNYSYANYHTQSTHTSGTCTATGGLDDRFDFILMSNYIKNGTAKIQYHNGSYIAYGQDGAHFNGAINSPTNSAVSATVADALYNMSDHLPVILQLDISQTPALSVNSVTNNLFDLNFENPALDNLNLFFTTNNETIISLKVYSITGMNLKEEQIALSSGNSQTIIDISNLSRGIYLLDIVNEDGIFIKRKFIKQ